MTYKRRIGILLNVVKRVYEKHPEMRESIDSVKVDVCAAEDISLEQVFFVLLFFTIVFIVMGHPNRRVEDINILCVTKIAYENSRVYFKKK